MAEPARPSGGPPSQEIELRDIEATLGVSETDELAPSQAAPGSMKFPPAPSGLHAGMAIHRSGFFASVRAGTNSRLSRPDRAHSAKEPKGLAMFKQAATTVVEDQRATKPGRSMKKLQSLIDAAKADARRQAQQRLPMRSNRYLHNAPVGQGLDRSVSLARVIADEPHHAPKAKRTSGSGETKEGFMPHNMPNGNEDFSATNFDQGTIGGGAARLVGQSDEVRPAGKLQQIENLRRKSMVWVCVKAHWFTVWVDVALERFFSFWEMLRDTHFDFWFTSFLIFRIFLRAVYIIIFISSDCNSKVRMLYDDDDAFPSAVSSVDCALFGATEEGVEQGRVDELVLNQQLLDWLIYILVEMMASIFAFKSNNCNKESSTVVYTDNEDKRISMSSQRFSLEAKPFSGSESPKQFESDEPWSLCHRKRLMWLCTGLISAWFLYYRDTRLLRWGIVRGDETNEPIWDATKNIVHLIAGTIIIAIDMYIMIMIAYMVAFEINHRVKKNAAIQRWYRKNSSEGTRRLFKVFGRVFFETRNVRTLGREARELYHLGEMLVPAKRFYSPYHVPTRLLSSIFVAFMFMLMVLAGALYAFIMIGKLWGSYLTIADEYADDLQTVADWIDDEIMKATRLLISLAAEIVRELISNYQDELVTDVASTLGIDDDEVSSRVSSYLNDFSDDEVTQIASSLASGDSWYKAISLVYPSIVNTSAASALVDAYDNTVESLSNDTSVTVNSVSTFNSFLVNGTLDDETIESDWADKIGMRVVNLTKNRVFDYESWLLDHEDQAGAIVDVMQNMNYWWYIALAAAGAVALSCMVLALVMTGVQYKKMVMLMRTTGRIAPANVKSDVNLWTRSFHANDHEAKHHLVVADVFGRQLAEDDVFTASQGIGFLGVFLSNSVFCSVLLIVLCQVVIYIAIINMIYFPIELAYILELAVIIGLPIVIDYTLLDNFVSDGTHVVHRSFFDLFDFLFTFMKAVQGAFSAVVRLIIITCVSLTRLFIVNNSSFPAGWSWLDPGYTCFVSMLLLQEKKTNPTMQAATRVIATLDPKIDEEREEICYAPRFDFGGSMLLSLAPRPICDTGDFASAEDVNAHDEIGLTLLAWRRLQMLWTMVGNPSLETWSQMKQRVHPLTQSMQRRLGDKFVNQNLRRYLRVSALHRRKMPDILNHDQLGHLKTAFVLLDKDHDGLVGLDDIRYHFQENGVHVTLQQGLNLLAFISCHPKGFFKHSSDWANKVHDVRRCVKRQPSKLDVERHAHDEDHLPYAPDVAVTQTGVVGLSDSREPDEADSPTPASPASPASPSTRLLKAHPSLKWATSVEWASDHEADCRADEFLDDKAIEQWQGSGFDFVEFLSFLSWRVAEAEPGSLAAVFATQALKHQQEREDGWMQYVLHCLDRCMDPSQPNQQKRRSKHHHQGGESHKSPKSAVCVGKRASRAGFGVQDAEREEEEEVKFEAGLLAEDVDLTVEDVLTEQVLRFVHRDSVHDVVLVDSPDMLFTWTDLVDLLDHHGLVKGVGHYSTFDAECMMRFLVHGRAITPEFEEDVQTLTVPLQQLKHIFRMSLFGGSQSAHDMIKRRSIVPNSPAAEKRKTTKACERYFSRVAETTDTSEFLG